ncbi:MAG: hypothetical protein KatS3mg013_1542 [Actinomycetota bacterium]|jgi:putative hydrolase of the HAD superfamily|nr:MAG: hypothetical protein KatS3mg013_1542 [Actinomycetota bacterium]
MTAAPAPARGPRAVVFDLFGTLVPELGREEFYASVDAAARRLGCDVEAFRAAWIATAPERQTGVWPTIADNVRAICRRIGAPEPDATSLAVALEPRAALYARRFAPRPGAIEVLRELRSRRRPVGLISMCAPDAPALWRATPLAPLVDVAVFSCEVGLRKPDPAIYRLACERMGVRPADCLYCGDGAYGELRGAVEVGMTAVLVRDPGLDPAEALRPDPEDWDGPAIDDLREVLRLVA